MSRWCQSTRHILDAYGRNIRSAPWTQHPASTRSRPIAQGSQRAAYSISSDTSEGASNNVSRKLTRPVPRTAPPPASGTDGSSRRNVPPSGRKSAENLTTRNNSRQPFGSFNAATKAAASAQHCLTKADQLDTSLADPRILEDILYTSRPRDRCIPSLLREYRNWSASSQLHRLNRSFLSDLVGVCGGLCLALVFSPQKSSLEIVESLFGRDAPSSAALGAFIAEVIRDMDKLGLVAQGDLFWLTQVQGALGGAGSSHNDSVRKISSSFNQLKDDSFTIESRVAYAAFLLSTGQPQLLADAAEIYTVLLNSSSALLIRHAELLWNLVTPRNIQMAYDVQERLCLALFRRVEQTTPSGPFRDINEGISISHITEAFAGTLFHGYDTLERSGSLRTWTTSQACQALSPKLPLETRWHNITLLGLAMAPTRLPKSYRGRSSTPTCSTMWRTTLMLQVLSRILSTPVEHTFEVQENIRRICRNLWELYTTTSSDQPSEVNRACIVAFFRLAATTQDEQLFARCSDFCRKLQLWSYNIDTPPSVRRQALDVITAFAAALNTWNRLDWRGLYTLLEHWFNDEVPWQSDVAAALVHYFAERDLGTAFDLRDFCEQSGITLSHESHVAVAVALVKAERWRTVSDYLINGALQPEGAETVVVAVMRHFQENRYEKGDSELMDVLSRVLPNIYASSRPAPNIKYPLRYFLSVLIRSGHGTSALRLIGSLKESADDFFSPHLLRRLAAQFMQKGHHADALKLHDMFAKTADTKRIRSIQHIRRNLSSQFASSGSRRLLYNLAKRQFKQRVSRRETLARISLHRRNAKNRWYFGRVRSLLSGPTSNATLSRDAVDGLLRHGRIYAARKLYGIIRQGLDPKTSTVIGNMILHAPMTGGKLRNGRLVRHILKTKDRLTADYGFVPDRATNNILLKAMLRWRRMFDARRVRQLFDNLVREGYPVSDRWRRQPHNVPFNTSAPQAEGFGVPDSASINFNRHTRPMYKMFIKAFYTRNDVAAAKTVVGILKEVQAEVTAEREKRARARRQGIIKKKLREAQEKEGRILDFDEANVL